MRLGLNVSAIGYLLGAAGLAVTTLVAPVPVPEARAPLPVPPAPCEQDCEAIEVIACPGPSGRNQRTPQQQQVQWGLAKLQPRLNRCARDHGGLDGTRISIEFSIKPDGSVAQSHARLPYTRTPLGRCVAATVLDFGSFPPSKRGLADVRRDVVLSP